MTGRILASSFVLLLALPAWAQGGAGDEGSVEVAESVEAAQASADDSGLGSVVVGLHIGPSMSVFSDLGIHVLPRLEVGYNLPPWGRRLEVFATLAYTRPSADGQVSDTRLPDSGSFTYEMHQDELGLGIGLLVRIFELGKFVNPYGMIGPQVLFLRTTVDGEAAGEAFGENTEQGTEFGVFGGFGVELVLGPGAAFFQLSFSWSDLAGRITGDSNTGNLSPSLGYRFMF